MINPALLLARTKKEAITRNWAAGVEIDPIPLELPGYYCDILLKFSLTYKTGSTTPAADTDWDAKIFKNLWIKASNLKPYLDLEDARYLKYEDFLRSHGTLYIEPLKTGTNLEDQEVKFQYHIHPGDLFLDKKDITDVIARRGLNNLALRLTWGEADAIGSGYTITSGKVEVVTSYVVLQPGVRETQVFPGMALPGRVARPSFFQPQWRVEEFGPVKVKKTFGYVQNFMNGFLLREVLLMVLDKNGDPVDHLVTQIRIANKESYDFWTKDLEELELENMQEFELSEPLAGIAWINLKDIWQKTRAGVYFANAEDMKWNFTTECTEDDYAYIVLVYRTHWRTESRADVIGKTPAEFVI